MLDHWALMFWMTSTSFLSSNWALFITFVEFTLYSWAFVSNLTFLFLLSGLYLVEWLQYFCPMTSYNSKSLCLHPFSVDVFSDGNEWGLSFSSQPSQCLPSTPASLGWPVSCLTASTPIVFLFQYIPNYYIGQCLCNGSYQFPSFLSFKC